MHSYHIKVHDYVVHLIKKHIILYNKYLLTHYPIRMKYPGLLTLLLMLILYPIQGFSQSEHTAPTLQVGLSGLSFERGELDAALIAEIIAEKQKEVQARLVQNMLLNNINVDNSLMYGYIDNTINLMLSPMDQQVRINSLMESTVNLAFVLGFAEYYLSTLKDGDSAREQLRLIANTYGTSIDTSFNEDKYFSADRLSMQDFTAIQYDEKLDENHGRDKITDNPEQIVNQFLSLYLDMAADVVYNNEELAKYGLMRTNTFSKYKEKNLYLKSIEEGSEQEFGGLTYVDVRDNMAQTLDQLLQIAGFLQSTITKGFNGENQNLEEIFTDLVDSALPVLEYEDIIELLEGSLENSIGLDIPVSENELTQLFRFVQGLKSISTENIDTQLRIYENDIRPIIEKLIIYSPALLQINDAIESALYRTGLDHLISFEGDISSMDLESPFLLMLIHLWNFDEAETYSLFLNQMLDAGDIFNDAAMQNSINKIISFVKSYVSFTEREEETYINLDVEGFLYEFRSIPYNRARPIEFYFNVGASTISFTDPLATSDTTSLSNYSFVGEKIGVKFKLWDWKYLRSFSEGDVFNWRGKQFKRLAPPKEPIVSDIHLLLYGSGILYNLVNTGTTSDFNSPLVGAGLGLTFYNNLNMNITYGKPLLSNVSFAKAPTYWGVGFDIDFIEYFNRLTEKRNANRTQKRLLEAQSN